MQDAAGMQGHRGAAHEQRLRVRNLHESQIPRLGFAFIQRRPCLKPSPAAGRAWLWLPGERTRTGERTLQTVPFLSAGLTCTEKHEIPEKRDAWYPAETDLSGKQRCCFERRRGRALGGAERFTPRPASPPRARPALQRSGARILLACRQGTEQLVPSDRRETRGRKPRNCQARCSKCSTFS